MPDMRCELGFYIPEDGILQLQVHRTLIGVMISYFIFQLYVKHL
jgi:hypothetical protein